MWVQQVATRVVEVLSHAESLFADPVDPPETTLDQGAGRAAEIGAAAHAQGGALSGIAAGAHRDLLHEASRRLGGLAGADAALADRLAEASADHLAGLSAAAALRADAADVPNRLAPWADVPAADLAALRALRAKVAGMGQLLAQHGAGDAEIARRIRDLGY